MQDAQGLVQGLEIILGDHGQDVLDLVGVDLAQDVQVDHVPFFQLVDVAEQPRRGQTTVGCQYAVGVFAAHRQGRTGQVPGAHLQYAVVGAMIDGAVSYTHLDVYKRQLEAIKQFVDKDGNALTQTNGQFTFKLDKSQVDENNNQLPADHDPPMPASADAASNALGRVTYVLNYDSTRDLVNTYY